MVTSTEYYNGGNGGEALIPLLEEKETAVIVPAYLLLYIYHQV